MITRHAPRRVRAGCSAVLGLMALAELGLRRLTLRFSGGAQRRPLQPVVRPLYEMEYS
jgi:hypothetical protein